MLASSTHQITDFLYTVLKEIYGEKAREYWANTKDTICYATTKNQTATEALIRSGGDIAIIVGGYNSSNTSHLAKLCSSKIPTYHVQDADEILDKKTIRHLDINTKKVIRTENWLPETNGETVILLTAGASCPDAIIENVMNKIISFYE